MNLNKKQVALAFAIMSALGQLLWTLAVALGIGKAILDWSFTSQYIILAHVLGSVTLGTAVLSIASAFVFGYIVGWIFAGVWNWAGKKGM
jgi:hypothetical protein